MSRNQTITFGTTNVVGNGNSIGSGNFQSSAREPKPRFINLTPHTVTVMGKSGVMYEFPSEGTIRLEGPREVAEYLDDIPLTEPQCTFQVVGSCLEVPDRSRLIVSSMVAEYAVKKGITSWMGAKNIRWYSPDTSPSMAIRDEKGNIIAVKALICYL